jgi:hypothetical protein
MITIRVSADVKDDRQVTLTLPPEVPTGRAELIINIASQQPERPKLPRSSLADWAEEHAEHWGEHLRSTDVEGFTGRRT